MNENVNVDENLHLGENAKTIYSFTTTRCSIR